MSKENYVEMFKDIQKRMEKFGKDKPEIMKNFGGLHSSAIADGVLSSKTKELISLAIGISVRCHGCIAFHVHEAMQAGATREEVLETVAVCVFMGGGPSMVYGFEALEAMEQFEANK